WRMTAESSITSARTLRRTSCLDVAGGRIGSEQLDVALELVAFEADQVHHLLLGRALGILATQVLQERTPGVGLEQHPARLVAADVLALDRDLLDLQEAAHELDVALRYAARGFPYLEHVPAAEDLRLE